MVVAKREDLVDYSEWRQNLLAEIDEYPDTIALGDKFVQRVLQMLCGLSEEEAIDATQCAGSGDKGADAVYIFPAEDGTLPRALVVQGKYGLAGMKLSVYKEAQKFFQALSTARRGIPVAPHIDKVAGVFKNEGQVRYLIATVEPLTPVQQSELEDVKKLAFLEFGSNLIVEVVSLQNIYALLQDVATRPPVRVDLPGHFLAVPTVPDASYTGYSTLADMYGMMRSYAMQTSGTLSTIYDYNIRKYLGRRAGSVNAEIYDTLSEEPELFFAYNNGIKIICSSAHQTEACLQLDIPYVSNGCQTTRTLYDLLDSIFGGLDPSADTGNKMARYREASFISIIVIVVPDDSEGTYASNITRYSNRQNGIRKKDFVALDSLYKDLKKEMETKGYFLETQAGEYEALPKRKREKYPKATHAINAFDATLYYAATWLGKPHLAFGHSSYFAPDGEEFVKTVDGLTADDLLHSWTLFQQARKLGYTDRIHRAKRRSSSDEHREQTRYLFLFLLFRLLSLVVIELDATAEDPGPGLGRRVRNRLARFSLDATGGDPGPSRERIYSVLKAVKADYDQTPHAEHPFNRLLTLADESVSALMELAEVDGWSRDRTAFLASKEAIQEERIILATRRAKIQVKSIANQVQDILDRPES
jgi:hypothetical protein